MKLTYLILTFLITVYSRYYLHRETGYKRFFNTVWFFYLGYNIAQNKIKKNTYGKGCIGENRNELIDSALFFEKI